MAISRKDSFLWGKGTSCFSARPSDSHNRVFTVCRPELPVNADTQRLAFLLHNNSQLEFHSLVVEHKGCFLSSADGTWTGFSFMFILLPK